MMKRYEVCLAVAEVYLDVEVNDDEGEEEAKEKALKLVSERDIYLCHQCGSKMEPCDPYVVGVFDSNGTLHSSLSSD